MIIFEHQDSLVEAFTTPAPYRWADDNNIVFRVGSTNYQANINSYENRNTQSRNIDVSFQWQTESGRWTFTLKKSDNPKDALTVISTILAATFEKEAKEKPDTISFSAFTDDNDRDAQKRFKLYKRIAERYAKERNYTLQVHDRSFLLTNNAKPSQMRRFPNDGVIEEDGLVYAEFPRVNAFTWAKMFWLDNAGDYIDLSLPHGRVKVTRTSEDVVTVDGRNAEGKIDNLDSSYVWLSMLGEIKVRTRTGREFTLSERGVILDAGDMILCDDKTIYYLSDEEMFADIWGYDIIEIV
ncbi:hypothetical protein VPFG_00105 [Vibrio phage nt-1]|uniref:Uncharacterized protein n=1 Tax=Vibrio phage nt-1 TaxID=115992 RepID=R9TJ39_9CAUD|nr:hypothetical protein VPFG_00105 [Vibrio phage nt-1]AGN30107.1 hypothetical protein VPFG_00105 [Vibrio phage nt-1]